MREHSGKTYEFQAKLLELFSGLLFAARLFGTNLITSTSWSGSGILNIRLVRGN